MSKLGRPKKRKADRLLHELRIRCTEEQWKRFHRAARGYRRSNLSEWARDMLDKASSPEEAPTPK